MKTDFDNLVKTRSSNKGEKTLQKTDERTILCIGVPMRIRVFLIVVLLVSCGLLFAGDIAIFQNLGFSPDSRYYMFAQYGATEKTSLPYAELFVVDVPANRFVPKGVKKATYDNPIEPGADGRGALFNLLTDSVDLKKRWNINHVLTGRLVYILLDGAEPKSQLEFRDFQDKKKYRITLVQSSRGSGNGVASSFHLLVTVEEASGRFTTHTVGLPEYWRKGVRRYRIKQVLLAPDERSVVIVVEREEQDATGVNIRYMVETLRP
jgi:predicted secreted protein